MGTHRLLSRASVGLSRVRKARRSPEPLASSPTRPSHFSFGLLYWPHVTRPAGSSLLSRPALRPFPALGPAPPAPPPAPLPRSLSLPLPAAFPSWLFQLPPPGGPSPATLPLPPRLFRRFASPPPGRSSLSFKMAVVSVWGISAVRPGSPGFRLSSPPVSSRGDHPRPPSTVEPEVEPFRGSLSRSAGSAGGCRPRRGLRRLPLLCARPRAGAPRPPPRAGPAPGRTPPRGPRAAGPNSPAVRPAGRAPPGVPVGCAGGERPRPRGSSGWVVPASPLSLGGAPTARGPTCARPLAAPASRGPPPPARPSCPVAPRRPLSGSGPGARRFPRRGCGGKWGGDRLAGVVVRRRQHVWCCVCRAVSPGAGGEGGGPPVNAGRCGQEPPDLSGSPGGPRAPQTPPRKRPRRSLGTRRGRGTGETGLLQLFHVISLLI